MPPVRPKRKKRAGSSYKNLAAEPPDHAIGRSRGGLTTKVHALTDAGCAPVTMMLSAGQAGDNPYLMPLIDVHKTSDRSRFTFSLTRPIRIPRPGNRCGRGGSLTPFPNALIRSDAAKPRELPAAGRQRSTNDSIESATPSSVVSTG